MPLCPGNRLAPVRHQLGRLPYRLVLGVDVTHEHRHADLDRDARIGNIGGRTVPDAVRAHMGHAGPLEDACPTAVILADGHVLPRMVRGRERVRATVLARRGGQQPMGFLAQGLGHAAGLAVGPDHAPVLQIHPVPLQRDDFGAAARELELQPDRQRQDGVIQSRAIGFQKVGIPEQLAHFLVADEVGGLAVGVHRDMAARVGAVRPIAPHFGQVEHLAHHAERAVRLGRLVGHLLHGRGHVGPLHVLHLHAAGHQDNDQ